jgi:hypothetical protein
VAYLGAPFHPVLDPRQRRERFQSMPLGHPTYLAAKANGDQSMLGTRLSLDDV